MRRPAILAAPWLFLSWCALAQSVLPGFPPGVFNSQQAVGGGGAAINPVWGDHGTLVTRSTTTTTNDTAAPSSAGFSSVRGTQGYSTGKHYVEFAVIVIPSSTVNTLVGLMDAATATGLAMDGFNLPNSCTSFANTGGGFNSGVSACNSLSGGGFIDINTSTLAIAFDGDNGFHYLGIASTGDPSITWLNGGVPTSGATGTGAVGVYSGSPTLYPEFSMRGDGTFQIKTGTYSPPSGYSAWNFLLKRDVIPNAANDNTPMWHEQVA